jgi:hypothetical protein
MAKPTLQGYTTKWFDQFTGTCQPSTVNWDIREDGPNWGGNKEVQQYTKFTANVYLSGTQNGTMCIAPTRVAPDPTTFIGPTHPPNWNSGRVECRLKWNCLPKQKMRFEALLRTSCDPITGRFIEKAQKGMWPAFWALGDIFRTTGDPKRSQWPFCGEWDIMEKRANLSNSTSSLHTGYSDRATWIEIGGSHNPAAQSPQFDPSQFNKFAIEVDCTTPGQETLTWYLNGIPGFSTASSR